MSGTKSQGEESVSTFRRNILVWLPSLKGEREHVAIDGHDNAMCGAGVDYSVRAIEYDPDTPHSNGCKRCLKHAAQVRA